MDVQTENFLEELTDRPVESNVETQTEAFLDRPPSPLFVPAKNGVDVETQIEGDPGSRRALRQRQVEVLHDVLRIAI